MGRLLTQPSLKLLGFTISKRARGTQRSNAHSYVSGYMIAAVDMTARNLRLKVKPLGRAAVQSLGGGSSSCALLRFYFKLGI